PASVTVRRRRARSALSLRATLGVPSAATCMRIRVGAATPGISRLSSAGSRTSGGAWLIENATEPSGDTRQPTASIAGWSRARTAMPPSTSAVPKPPRSLPLSSYSTMPATSNARRYWMPSMMGAGVRPASVIRITPSSSTMSMRRAVMRSWSGASTRVCGVREAMMRSSVCTEGRFGAASLADAGRAVQSAAKTNGTAAACFKGILCSVGGCDAMSQGYASRATTGIPRQEPERGGLAVATGLRETCRKRVPAPGKQGQVGFIPETRMSAPPFLPHSRGASTHPTIHGGTMKIVIYLMTLVVARQAAEAGAQALWGGAVYGMDVAQVQATVPQARVPDNPDELAGGESEGLRVEGVELAGHRFQASYFFAGGAL